MEEEPFLSPNLKTNQLIRKKFKEAGFQAKLDEIEGYYVARITTFPEVEVYKIDVEQVREWHKKNPCCRSSLAVLRHKDWLPPAGCFHRSCH